jgi:hypothetical protein
MPDSDTSVRRVDITLPLANWVKASRLRFGRSPSPKKLAARLSVKRRTKNCQKFVSLYHQQ